LSIKNKALGLAGWRGIGTAALRYTPIPFVESDFELTNRKRRTEFDTADPATQVIVARGGRLIPWWNLDQLRAISAVAEVGSGIRLQAVRRERRSNPRLTVSATFLGLDWG
jgi:hypothetical protein